MRYLVLATALVLGAILILVNVPDGRRSPPGAVHFSSGTATPGPAQNGDVLGTPGAVIGEAPWALSSLPECLHEQLRRDGRHDFAHRAIPLSAVRLGPGTRLRIVDCTLDIGDDTIGVRRGEDRLVVPPDARLYRAGGRLFLERSAGGIDEVRVYDIRR